MRVKTNEIIPISKGVFVIGRSASSADYVIEDNQSISRVHAIFNVSGGMCTISDNRSLNKTYLNDQELIPDEKYPLQHDDRIKLYNEIFVYQKNI